MTITSMEAVTASSELSSSNIVLLHLLAQLRDQAREEQGTSEIAGWAHVLDEQVLELIDAGEIDTARHVMQERLGLRHGAR